MAKTKISEFSSTAADNTDITNINIAEGCSPANLNNSIRSLMALLKDQQTGSSGDPFTVAGTLVASGQAVLSGTLNVTGSVLLDGTAGASGQALISAGNGNTPTWSNLGTIASQNANAVSITGGTITGITDLTVADGGTGASSITANSVILGNGTSALSGNLVAPSTSGNVLTSNGTTWTSAANTKVTSGTTQNSTSGTSINFTSIPAGTKRITVNMAGVSVNGSSAILVQVGSSGTPKTSGYSGTATYLPENSTTTASTLSSGFLILTGGTSAGTFHGTVTLTLLDAASYQWIGTINGGLSNTSIGISGGGSVNTASTLDMVRITTVNGTDTFDSGLINILYE